MKESDREIIQPEHWPVKVEDDYTEQINYMFWHKKICGNGLNMFFDSVDDYPVRSNCVFSSQMPSHSSFILEGVSLLAETDFMNIEKTFFQFVIGTKRYINNFPLSCSKIEKLGNTTIRIDFSFNIPFLIYKNMTFYPSLFIDSEKIVSFPVRMCLFGIFRRPLA